MPLLNSDGSPFVPPPPRQPTFDELSQAFYDRYMLGLAEWERWRQARREQGDDYEEVSQL